MYDYIKGKEILDCIACQEDAYDIPDSFEVPDCFFKRIEATTSEIGQIKDGWLITGCEEDCLNNTKKYFRAVLASSVLSFVSTIYREYDNFELVSKHKFYNMEYFRYYKTLIR